VPDLPVTDGRSRLDFLIYRPPAGRAGVHQPDGKPGIPLRLVEKEKTMKIIRMAFIAILMSGLSLGALPLTAAANHNAPERLPNGVLYEPISADADGGSRIKFPWSKH
jgi:hypothetical protein